MLNIALIGYGKMGRMLHSLAEANGCCVKAIIDPALPEHSARIEADVLREVEVCLDFTHPDMVMDNIRQLAALQKNMVIGTTGWYEQMDEVKKLAAEHRIGIVYGANFSIGMNIFDRILAHATDLMDKFRAYDVWGLEMHHNQKADSPSGTAIQLANTIIKHHGVKEKAVFEKVDYVIRPEELHFASVRSGSIPGVHRIGFDSDADSITLEHSIRNRSGLALGALEAALWVQGKKGFYSFNQMMDERLC